MRMILHFTSIFFRTNEHAQCENGSYLKDPSAYTVSHSPNRRKACLVPNITSPKSWAIRFSCWSHVWANTPLNKSNIKNMSIFVGTKYLVAFTKSREIKWWIEKITSLKTDKYFFWLTEKERSLKIICISYRKFAYNIKKISELSLRKETFCDGEFLFLFEMACKCCAFCPGGQIRPWGKSWICSKRVWCAVLFLHFFKNRT